MPKGDVLQIGAIFLAAGGAILIPPTQIWGIALLVIGLVWLALYVAMGRFKIIIHYAGWGKGPEEPDLLTVTQALQDYIDSGRGDVKASTVFFSEVYASPRILKVVYSRGRWGENKNRRFVEHELVRID